MYSERKTLQTGYDEGTKNKSTIACVRRTFSPGSHFCGSVAVLALHSDTCEPLGVANPKLMTPPDRFADRSADCQMVQESDCIGCDPIQVRTKIKKKGSCTFWWECDAMRFQPYSLFG